MRKERKNRNRTTDYESTEFPIERMVTKKMKGIGGRTEVREEVIEGRHWKVE